MRLSATRGRLSLMADVRRIEMKKASHILPAIAAVIFICSCTDTRLPVAAADVSLIRISRFSKFPNTQILTEIDDTNEIARMINTFSFGEQRHLTVKHPLPILIDVYSGTNAICRLSCENRMMRLGNWEYTMSRDTARMIQNTIKK